MGLLKKLDGTTFKKRNHKMKSRMLGIRLILNLYSIILLLGTIGFLSLTTCLSPSPQNRQENQQPIGIGNKTNDPTSLNIISYGIIGCLTLLTSGSVYYNYTRVKQNRMKNGNQ